MLRISVIGAGERGMHFGRHVAEQAGRAQVVGVADLNEGRRNAFAAEHRLDAGHVFRSWEELIQAPRFCDAVVVSTMDRDHVAPALAFLKAGYHLMLEKPMATTLADCRAIEAAQRASGAIMGVCHSLRYHQGFSRTRSLLHEGAIGRLLSVDQLEQVAYWHYASSYVRGNWRREADSSFMLMTKSCHDIDYLCHLVGRDCLRVASSGSLNHFRPENAPAGATARCTDGCPLEKDCAFSALKIYVDCKRDEWPADIVSLDHSREAHLEALRTGPYGRCVWKSDNDVVDHQVVMMEFEGGATASFTMTLATHMGRKLRLHGTEGEIYFGDAENRIILKRFAGEKVEEIQMAHERGGHGGGDQRVVKNWIEAMEKKDPGLILASAQESLKTHSVVFAAEKARRERRSVAMGEMDAN